VRQLILSPRWIVWHVLTLGAMTTCGFLAAWQWGRAGSAMGSALNVGYGLQWPVFAVFFGYMWWRFLRMELAELKAPADAEAPEAPEAAEVVESTETPGSTGITAAAEAEPVEPAAAPGPEEPSPFGPRPASARVPRVSDEDDPELAEYNRMLAALAARDAAR
jgi:DNA-binding transcriptional regulator of glucitol operon